MESFDTISQNIEPVNARFSQVYVISDSGYQGRIHREIFITLIPFKLQIVSKLTQFLLTVIKINLTYRLVV